MKKIDYYLIVENRKLNREVYSMTVIAPEIAGFALPGQFVEMYVEGGKHLLPRPISICEATENGCLRLVYRVAGKGTEHFSTLQAGDKIRIMGPLGNGFPLAGAAGKTICIAGGGVGAPPMLELAKRLKEESPDSNITVFLGFRSQPFLIEDFARLGLEVHISTDDGSVGFRGNLLENIKFTGKDFQIFYACGPRIMLKSLSLYATEKDRPVYVSMEERMACGLGACVGCVAKIRDGEDFIYKKVCKDGPVFEGREVVWE